MTEPSNDASRREHLTLYRQFDNLSHELTATIIAVQAMQHHLTRYGHRVPDDLNIVLVNLRDALNRVRSLLQALELSVGDHDLSDDD